MAIRVFHKDEPDVMVPFIAADARLIVWLGTGSETANMNYVWMKAGEANVPHVHDGSEDTIFVLDGKGSIEDLTNGKTYPFGAGQAVYVQPGIRHCVKADRGSDIVSVGGPSPADRAMAAAVAKLKDET